MKSNAEFFGEWQNWEEIPKDEQTIYPSSHSTHPHFDRKLLFEDEKIIECLNTLGNKNVNVYEFGPSAALKSKYLFEKTDLKVEKHFLVDLPEVCEVIQNTLSPDSTLWTSNILGLPDCPIDIFYADSSIQYYPDQVRLYLFIQKIKPKMVIIRRTPLTSKDPFWVLQLFQESKIPHFIQNESFFLAFFIENGYSLRWLNEHCEFDKPKCWAIDVIWQDGRK